MGMVRVQVGEANIFIFLKSNTSRLIVLLMAISFWCYFAPKFVSMTTSFDKFQNTEQDVLLSEIKELTEKPLKTVVVEPYAF